MPTNRAFWRALNALAHPVSIAAVVTLLFNDHWLRWNYPSWLTGKLGDFAWLLFAPFVAGLLFAWFIPRRIRQHEHIVGIVSITLIGLWFALAKTVPLVHSLTTTAWENIVGWQGTLRMDATDLLTLPALWISWQIWQHVSNSALNLRPIGYVIFGLAIVGTLASDGPLYDVNEYGIGIICKDGSQLIALVDGKFGNSRNVTQEFDFQNPPPHLRNNTPLSFISNDGGLTWHSNMELVSSNGLECANRDTLTVQIPDSPVQYRWVLNEHIEQSNDGGQTWTSVYDLIEVRQQIREDYHEKKKENWSVADYVAKFLPVPISGFFDSNSGNMLFAMGWNGILLKTPAGEWKWVAVGLYRLDDIRRFDQVPSILFFQVILAAILILLILVTFATYIQENRWSVQEFLVAFCWIGWILPLLISMSFFDLSQISYFVFAVAIIIILGILMIFVLTIASIPVFWRYRKELKMALVIGLIAAFLYLLPLLIWTQGTIPRYSTAATFSFILVISATLAGFHHYQQLYPPKKKKKVEELVER